MCVFFWRVVSLVRVVFTKFEAQLAVHYTDSHHQNGRGNWYKKPVKQTQVTRADQAKKAFVDKLIFPWCP